MQLDQKKRSRLVKSITFTSVVSIGFALVLILYILPTYDVIESKIDAINALNSSYTKLKKDGVDVAQYQSLVAKYASVKKQSNDKVDTAAISYVLKKDSKVPEYLDWVKSELSKEPSLDKEIEKNNRVIGQILPTYTDVTDEVPDDFDKNRINLGQLVNFVEENLLRKYSLESFSSIGFSSLTFDSKPSAIINIGSYKLNLDITGSNKNLLQFVDAIQTSGNLTLKDGKIVDPDEGKLDTGSGTDTGSGNTSDNTPKLTNLLITIDSIRFTDSLDNPDKDNKASAVVVLYVRARSYSDLINIRASLADKISKLSVKMKKISDICGTIGQGDCLNNKIYASVQSVKSLQDDMKALNDKMQNALKSSTITDINLEFDSLFSSYNTFKTLEEKVLNEEGTINAERKDSASAKK